MSDKKHIDRLFQEKLKDFEAIPSADVWENISAKLVQPKKDRKLIPLWWKLAGIAAGLVILIALGTLIGDGNDAQINPNTIVNTEDAEQDSNASNIEDNKSNDVINNINSQDQVTSDDPSLNQNDELLSSDAPKTNVLTEQKKIQKNKAVIAISNTKGEKIQKKEANALIPQNKTQNTVVDQGQESPFSSSEDNSTTIDKKKAEELLKGTDKTTDAVANSDTKSANESVKDTSAKEEDDKLSLTDELEEDENAEDEVVQTAETGKRWSVNPNIAPVYFNSFGSGSSIDDQFVNNSRTGDINMSYGVGAAYELNSKLSLRAGINQVNIGYSTNNIVVYNNIEPNIEDKPLKNVNLNQNSQDLSFLSGNGLNFAQVPGVVSDNIKSSIDQELGFIEVPLELEYKISDKKLGLSVIGGFSTLFLNQNEIYSSLQGERTLLGEATNINKTSFSANLGVGVNYKVSKQIDLNLEPVLKYQLNTFSDTSGNFNPYFFGVYTGFSFKF